MKRKVTILRVNRCNKKIRICSTRTNMMMKLFCIGLIISLTPMIMNCGEIVGNKATLPITVDVVDDIRKHLHSGCINLLHVLDITDTELRVQQTAMYISRMLSRKDVPTAVLRASVLERGSLWCQRNLPLHVILSNSNATRTFLKELPAKSLRGASWFLDLNGVTSEQFFKDVDIPFDCLFIVARSSGHVAINLTEVYRVDASLPITESPYCTWTARKGLSCPEANFFRRRSTLRDLSLRVIWPDATVVEDIGSKKLKIFFQEIWKDIAKNLQFIYVPIVRMDDHKGNKLNDSWTGMIGDISTGVAHVAVDPTGMKTERTMVVDFTMPLFTFKISIFIKEPDSAFSWGRFLAPFSRNLWWAVATTLLMIIVFLSLIHHVGRVYGNAEAEGPEFYSLYNCVIYVFGIFCQQGNEVTPRSWSCRIVYWMAYFTSMILLASYSGTLISFLTIKHNPLPFSDVTGLLQDKSYQVGMLRSYSQIVTKSKDVPLLLENTAQKLLDKMSRTKRNAPSTALEGLSLVCTSKYALLITASALTPLADDLPCGVVPLPRFSFEIGMSYIIAGGSPYRSIINWKINALRDGGILKRGFPPVDSNKFSKLQEGFIKVGFKEVAPIVTLLGAGAVLGCVILLVECCLSRGRRRSCQYK